MRRVSNSQTVISEGAKFVGVGSNSNVAIIEIMVTGIPISAKKIIRLQLEVCRLKDSRLIEADTVRQYLDCGGGGGLRLARRTELGADLVRARDGRVTRQCDVGEVVTLLGVILDEGSRVKVGLRDVNIEDRVARRDINWHGQIHTIPGGC